MKDITDKNCMLLYRFDFPFYFTDTLYVCKGLCPITFMYSWLYQIDQMSVNIASIISKQPYA